MTDWEQDVREGAVDPCHAVAPTSITDAVAEIDRLRAENTLLRDQVRRALALVPVKEEGCVSSFGHTPHEDGSRPCVFCQPSPQEKENDHG